MVAKTKSATTKKKPVASKKRVAKTAAVEKKKTAAPKPLAAAEKKQTAVKKGAVKKAAASGASVKETAGKTTGEATQAVVKKKTATPKKPAGTKKEPVAPKKPAGAKKEPATPKKPAAAKKEPAAPKQSAVAKEKPAASKKPAVAKEKPAASKKPAVVKKKPAAPKKPVAETTDAPKKAVSPYQEEAGEEYMNAKQSQHFRKLLINWKQTLMEEVERTVHHMQDEASNFPDPNDRATQEEEFALELRTRDRERKLIKKINESLITLETGDYGYCEVCGVEIGVKRLEARPTATLCIDCKTIDEIKERQRA